MKTRTICRGIEFLRAFYLNKKLSKFVSNIFAIAICELKIELIYGQKLEKFGRF